MSGGDKHIPAASAHPLRALIARGVRILEPPGAAGWTWRGYAAWLGGTAGVLLASAIVFVLLIGPYGPTPFSLPIDRPAVFRQQRYAFPALIRSGKFDGFVVGTSTARPIDPEVLGQAFGGHMANVSIYALTAFEQKLNAELIARQTRSLRTFVWGLDAVWCYRNVGETFHRRQPMPRWLYDDDPWNDIGYLVNMKALEVSLSRVMHLIGLKKLRVRGDGYLVETPPENTYDAARASALIWENVKRPHSVVARMEPDALAPVPKLRFPALSWIEGVLASLPRSARKVLVMMPIHIAAMPALGSDFDRRMQGCKAELMALAKRQNATLIDFRFRSPLTQKDQNFWDTLHYRRHLAPLVMDAIVAGATEGRSTDVSVVLNWPSATARKP